MIKLLKFDVPILMLTLYNGDIYSLTVHVILSYWCFLSYLSYKIWNVQEDCICNALSFSLDGLLCS